MTERSIEFQAIHDTYRPKVLRYLTRLVGESEAEDLAQQVLVKVSEGLPRFRGESGLSTWIYRIATNTALDKLRSSGVEQARRSASAATSTDEGDDSEAEGLPVEEQAPSVETTAIRAEMNACILEFIERLPGPYRTVMVLSELEGFNNGEIADILGVSLGTVKIRLHRAREKLRGYFAAGCSFYQDERNGFACDRKP